MGVLQSFCRTPFFLETNWGLLICLGKFRAAARVPLPSAAKEPKRRRNRFGFGLPAYIVAHGSRQRGLRKPNRYLCAERVI